MLWLDQYERRARLVPGLLAILPVPIVFLSLGLSETPVVSGLVSLLALAGGPVVLAGVVRSRGLRRQDRLFEEWGGSPTTHALKLSHESPSDAIRNQRRTKVEELVGSALPTLSEERSDPQGAESRYNAAIAVLRELTRDEKRFRLVFQDNRNYGFDRNSLGMRTPGLVIAVLGVFVVAAAWYLSYRLEPINLPSRDVLIGLGALIALAVYWWAYPTTSRVHQAAENYAARLLDATLTL